MKRKIVKFLIIILIVLIFSSIFCSKINATISENFKGDIEAAGDDMSVAKTSAQKILSSVLDIIRLVGASVAVIILIVLACKYILASAGDRADIKKYAINYVIGALILFGASGIASLIQKFVNSATGASGEW